MVYVPAPVIPAGTISPSPIASPTSAIHLLTDTGGTVTIAQLSALLGNAVVAATAATLAGVPGAGVVGTAITGVTATLSPAGATGYAVLYSGGADQGARIAFTGTAVPSLTPTAAASTTIRVYAAATGGAALAESGAITVSAAAVTATGATLSGLPTTGTAGAALTMTGASDTLTPAGATGYAVLATGGADVGARTAFTGTAPPALTPSASGSYAYLVYAAATGGTVLATSPTITVAAGGPANNYVIGWYSGAAPSSITIGSHYAGSAYGSPKTGTTSADFFTLTPTAGGSAIPNSTTGVRMGWGTSATTPPGPATQPSGFSTAIYNGYTTPSTASGSYFFDTSLVTGTIGTTVTYYPWWSVDSGATWSRGAAIAVTFA